MEPLDSSFYDKMYSIHGGSESFSFKMGSGSDRLRQDLLRQGGCAHLPAKLQPVCIAYIQCVLRSKKDQGRFLMNKVVVLIEDIFGSSETDTLLWRHRFDLRNGKLWQFA